MDVSQLKEGKRFAYTLRKTTGTAKVVQVYKDKGGRTRVVLHDKVNNRSITAFPSQLSAVAK